MYITLHELQENREDLLSMLHSVTKMPPLSRVLYSHCMSQIPIVIGNGRNKYPVTWIVSNSSEGWYSSRESKEGVTRTIKSALWLAQTSHWSKRFICILTNPLLISTVFLKYPLELKKNSVSLYWNFFQLSLNFFSSSNFELKKIFSENWKKKIS